LAVGRRVALIERRAEPPAVCGDPTVTTLIADEVVPVGSVEVAQDGTSALRRLVGG
jgi:hypothetical protein